MSIFKKLSRRTRNRSNKSARNKILRKKRRLQLEKLDQRRVFAVAIGDFNGDGFDDIATGRPDAEVSGQTGAGVVEIAYGGSAGTRQTLHQGPLKKLEGKPEKDDAFGTSVAVGDFNNDGYDDLAVGVPGEDFEEFRIKDGGMVQVIYGSKKGLTSSGDQVIRQGGILGGHKLKGTLESGDRFGESLAVGNFNGDKEDDLAIGAPHEDVLEYNPKLKKRVNVKDAGLVHVIYGSSKKLTGDGDEDWAEASTSIRGVSEENDQFGFSLVAGDFNNDGEDDLAIGVPYEDIGSIEDAGSVHVLYGHPTKRLNASGNQVWQQNTKSIHGVSHANDHFGYALAAGNFNGKGGDDLAVGVPDEDIGSIKNAGAVNVLYGLSGSGLNASGNQLWHQNTNSVAGTAERDDRFGFALSAGDFDKDKKDDLAIGVPYEDIGSYKDAGGVNVLYGHSSKRLNASRDQFWHQDTKSKTGHHVKGEVEEGDRFGESLAVGRINKGNVDDLIVEVPGEDVGALDDAGLVHVLYGSTKTRSLDTKYNRAWSVPTVQKYKDRLLIDGTSWSDQVIVSPHAGSKELKISVGHEQIIVSAAGIRKISFDGKSGDDKFVNKTSIPSTALGGKGDDYLQGGSGKDELYGNKGHDTLVGGSGKDTIFGAPLEDRIDGGKHDDTIQLTLSFDDEFNKDWALVPSDGKDTIHVRLDLESVIDEFVEPVFERVDDVVGPIIDLLDKEVPVISKFADYTYADLIDDFGYGDITDFVEVYESLEKIVKHDWKSEPIVVGTMKLVGADVVSNKVASQFNKTLKIISKDVLKGTNIDLPVLTNANSILAIAAGKKDVTLVSFDLPELKVGFDYDDEWKTGLSGWGLKAEVSAEFDFRAGASFRFTTAGLTSGDWEDGLGIKAWAKIEAEIKAGGGVTYGIGGFEALSGGVRGVLDGEASWNWDSKKNSFKQKGKLDYRFELYVGYRDLDPFSRDFLKTREKTKTLDSGKISIS